MTPELKEKLLRYANEKEPFTAHNHIRVCDIDEGSSRLELDLMEQSLNRWGQPHGGVLFTLADDACGLAHGWEERQPVYRLWPLLVHVRLFGGVYHQQAGACLEQLGL